MTAVQIKPPPNGPSSEERGVGNEGADEVKVHR